MGGGQEPSGFNAARVEAELRAWWAEGAKDLGLGVRAGGREGQPSLGITVLTLCSLVASS